jgi:hypothetical protein
MPYAVDPRRQNSAIIGLFPGQEHLYQLHGMAFADRALVDILPVLRPQKNGSGCAYPTMVFRIPTSKPCPSAGVFARTEAGVDPC